MTMYIRQLDPKKMRINPHTNKPWKAWDARPTKNAENGYCEVLGKKYKVNDRHVFDSYFTNRKMRDGTISETDSHGYYYERWTVPREGVCQFEGCEEQFLYLRERKNNCDLHCQTFRDETHEEMLANNYASCGRSKYIARRTGCSGEKIPLDIFKNLDGTFSQKRNKDYIRSQCNLCKDEVGWIGRLKREHKMTPEEYDIQFQKQNGVCAVCSLPEKKRKRLSVDHDHQFDGTDTRLNRGLVCDSCNSSLRDRSVDDLIGSELHLQMAIYLKLAELTVDEGFNSGSFSVNNSYHKKAISNLILVLQKELNKID